MKNDIKDFNLDKMSSEELNLWIKYKRSCLKDSITKLLNAEKEKARQDEFTRIHKIIFEGILKGKTLKGVFEELINPPQGTRPQTRELKRNE